jgi:predicted TIM-barrel fold metal-dependent hydrolase
VTQAWAGSFEGLLHKDIAGVNQRLVEECRRFPMLVPFGSVNPTLPDWQEDLRRCKEEWQMPGIRLHPGYHGYGSGDPIFAEVLRAAAARDLMVQLAVSMEDTRTQHPLLHVPAVEMVPLPPLLRELPNLRLVLLNAFTTVRPDEAHRLVQAGAVYFEISRLESVGGIANLLTQVPLERILFGSSAPFFYFEAAQLKLAESALSAEQLHAISSANATALLRGV